jgi:hypothetical protein
VMGVRTTQFSDRAILKAKRDCRSAPRNLQSCSASRARRSFIHKRSSNWRLWAALRFLRAYGRSN